MTHISALLFQFVIFSIVGWIMEVIYRSLRQRRFINPGFLFGPYLPIYGSGALIISTLAHITYSIPIWVKFFIYTFTLSVLEFCAGWLLLQITGKRYWDYSNERGNIQGHVCIGFSLIWGVLALAFEYAILPLYSYSLSLLPTTFINTFALMILLTMIIDGLVTHKLYLIAASIISNLGNRIRSELHAIYHSRLSLTSPIRFFDSLMYNSYSFNILPVLYKKITSLLHHSHATWKNVFNHKNKFFK